MRLDLRGLSLLGGGLSTTENGFLVDIRLQNSRNALLHLFSMNNIQHVCF